MLVRDLIFEIGTEELPARFIPSSLEQMSALAQELLEEYRLPHGGIKTYGTPRRLVLYVRDLRERQGEKIEEIKGPPAQVAFTPEGTPTKAALGFARSQGVEVDSLVVKELNGGRYVFAVKRQEGLPTVQVLPSLLKRLVESLTFPKVMRWGEVPFRFARPIRWFLALYGEEVIPFELAGVASSNLTWGHRFLAPGAHEVREARSYFQVMAENYVVVDPEERARRIREGAQRLAGEKGGWVEEDRDLLEENTFLVEYPMPLLGSFDPSYLQLPREVIITSMKEHQRYFPVWKEGGELLPFFIAIHNGTDQYKDLIVKGYERVLGARLADASFFYHQDLQIPLHQRIEKLQGIIFQEKLGTMLSKSRRLVQLSLRLRELLDLPPSLDPYIKRTAELAKADLTTSMVYEFPELQGIMGYYYALHDGEAPEVCQGIKEHYWPRFPGDALPRSLTGMVVGLADRLDTLVGCFGVGLIPSGSEDPWGLRRQAMGLVLITIDLDLHYSLPAALAAAHQEYGREGIELTRPPSEVINQVSMFCQQRLQHILGERKIPMDVIDACLAVREEDLADVYRRCLALNSFRQGEGFSRLRVAFTRAFNLARQAPERYAVRPELLKEEEERVLWWNILDIREKVRDLVQKGEYVQALEELARLREPVDRFFDKIMVMVPQEDIRRNRLALLQEIVELVHSIADFSRLGE